jgi:hypothetical protein
MIPILAILVLPPLNSQSQYTLGQGNNKTHAVTIHNHMLISLLSVSLFVYVFHLFLFSLEPTTFVYLFSCLLRTLGHSYSA